MTWPPSVGQPFENVPKLYGLELGFAAIFERIASALPAGPLRRALGEHAERTAQHVRELRSFGDPGDPNGVSPELPSEIARVNDMLGAVTRMIASGPPGESGPDAAEWAAIAFLFLQHQRQDLKRIRDHLPVFPDRDFAQELSAKALQEADDLAGHFEWLRPPREPSRLGAWQEVAPHRITPMGPGASGETAEVYVPAGGVGPAGRPRDLPRFWPSPELARLALAPPAPPTPRSERRGPRAPRFRGVEVAPFGGPGPDGAAVLYTTRASIGTRVERALAALAFDAALKEPRLFVSDEARFTPRVEGAFRYAIPLAPAGRSDFFPRLLLELREFSRRRPLAGDWGMLHEVSSGLVIDTLPAEEDPEDSSSQGMGWRSE